ncbi:MAG: hypothetical protein RJB38_269 [Pseudomonadota bacterium]|jgi:hypothetical protein
MISRASVWSFAAMMAMVVGIEKGFAEESVPSGAPASDEMTSEEIRGEESPTIKNGRERRWDFECQFESQNSCRALATIYTVRELDHHDRGQVESKGGPAPAWSYLNRLAVACEHQGLFYAGGSSVAVQNGHLWISAANGRRPRLIFDLPLNQPTASNDHHQTSAKLMLPSGMELHGSCQYSHHEIH